MCVTNKCKISISSKHALMDNKYSVLTICQALETEFKGTMISLKALSVKYDIDSIQHVLGRDGGLDQGFIVLKVPVAVV